MEVFQYSNASLCDSEDNSTARAIKCFEKALEINPVDSYSWYKKGVLLRNLGNHEQALKCFEKTLELSPGHSGASQGKRDLIILYNLGKDAK